MKLDNKDKVSAYYQGYIDACRDYAIWKDGVQYLGVMETELHIKINELREAEHKLINTL